MKKNQWIRAAFVALLLIAGSSVVISVWVPEPENFPQTIQIAWIGPLTGNASILGTDNLKAVELAIKEFNETREKGEPELVIRSFDDQYSAQRSEGIYRVLKEGSLPQVIFLSTYEAMFSLGKSFTKDKIIVINPIDNDLSLSGLHNNIFLIAKRTEQLASIVSDALVKNDSQNVAILYFDGDSFMPTVANEIRDQFRGAGRTASMYPYQNDPKNFAEILPGNVLSALDGVVLLGYSEMEQAVLYIRKHREDVRLYSVNTALALAENNRLIPKIEGMHIAHFTRMDGNPEKAENFIMKFSENFGRPPLVDWIAFQAWDASQIFLRSLRNIYRNPGGSRAFYYQLKSDLLQGELYNGVSGDIRINADGTSDGIYMGSYTIIGGKPVRNQD